MSQCRICWDDTESKDNRLIAPCLCSGTSERIHAECWRNCLYQCNVCLFPEKSRAHDKLLLEREIERLKVDMIIIHMPPPRRRLNLFLFAILDILAYIAIVSTFTWSMCRLFDIPSYATDYGVMTMCGLTGRGAYELFRYRYHLRRLCSR